jgi:outer membrane protein assembly factor BamB
MIMKLRPGLCTLLLLTSAFSLCAAHWPAFRGPHGDGLAEKESVPTHFNQASNLLWTTEMLPGLSSPVIWSDRVFVTCEEGNRLSTVCFEAASGRKLWDNAIIVEKLEPVHKANSHATSTPAIDGKAVYVYFGSFGLVAYDLTGKELWRKPLPVPKTFFDQGTGTSPIVAEDKLLVFLQLGSESHLLALSAAEGRELWKAPMPIHNNSYSTPVTWQEGGHGCVGLACATRFTAYELADGHEAWWVEGLGYQASSTPVVVGNRLVMALAGVQGEVSNMTPPPTFDEMVKKYDRDGDGLVAYEEVPEDLLYTDRQTSDGRGNMRLRGAMSMFGGVKRTDKLNQEKWNHIRDELIGFRSGPMNRTTVLAVRTGGKGNVTESQVQWKETRGVPEVPSPLAWQNRVFLIRSGGLLVCRDLETGKQLYEERIDAPGGYFASPVLACGRLYLASDRGTVTVVKAGDALEVLARNELGDPIFASPAVADNRLYIRSSKRLWAFGEAKR